MWSSEVQAQRERDLQTQLQQAVQRLEQVRTELQTVKDRTESVNSRIDKIKVVGEGHSGTGENMRFEAAQLGGNGADEGVSVLDDAAYVTFNGTVYENNTIYGIVGTPL